MAVLKITMPSAVLLEVPPSPPPPWLRNARPDPQVRGCRPCLPGAHRGLSLGSDESEGCAGIPTSLFLGVPLCAPPSPGAQNFQQGTTVKIAGGHGQASKPTHVLSAGGGPRSALWSLALTGQLPVELQFCAPSPQRGHPEHWKAIWCDRVSRPSPSNLTCSISLQPGVTASAWEHAGPRTGPRDTPTVHGHRSQNLG